MNLRCPVLPPVRDCREEQGRFLIHRRTRIVTVMTENGEDRLRLRCAAELLAKTMERRLAFKPLLTAASEGFSLPSVPGGNEILLEIAPRGELEMQQEEAYSLRSSEERLHLRGNSACGVLYAVQTLRQIIEDSGLVLPLWQIDDAPRFPRRGFYHDVTRGRIPNLTALKELVETMSCYKLNELQLYIEHSYLFTQESEVWRDDQPLTAAEIMELDQYCFERGVELVPSIASFGHLEKLLQTRGFAKHCELEVDVRRPFTHYGRMRHHTVDVFDEEIFAHLCCRIDEFAALCRSRRFNICGDETFDLGRGKNQETCAKIGKSRLYIDFIKKLERHLTSRGLHMQFWGDVIASEPELAGELSQTSCCLVWDYAYEPRAKGAEVFAELGIEQYLCPGVCGWNCKLQYNEGAYYNNLGMTRYAEQYGARGLLNTNWGDFAHINDPYLAFPGLIYGACFSWSSTAIAEVCDYETMNRLISEQRFGKEQGGFLELSDRLFREDAFDWMTMIRFYELRISAEGEALAEAEKEILREAEAKLRAVNEESRRQKFAENKEALSRMIFPTDSESLRLERLCYLYGADWIDLTNRLGFLLLERSGLAAPAENYEERARALAVELEYFAKDYEALWLARNKQSELARLQAVLYYYCDLLRAERTC